MGLQDDFYEFVRVWQSSSWKMKAYLLLTAFLASGSIATLSETVFHWKGFVNDAIFFYQIYIADQIQNLLKLFFNAPSGLSHFLILTGIYLGANLRVSRLTLPETKAHSVALHAVTSYVGVATAMTIFLHFSDRMSLNSEFSLGLFAGSAFSASFSYWRAGGAARILWLTTLLSPFVIVGLAAAITSGLSRTT